MNLTKHRFVSALVVVALGMALAACDSQGTGPGQGDALPVEDHVTDLPTSRAAYSDLATFVLPGRVLFFRPGTSPDDPPELVRTLSFPELLVWDAQTDRDGYVWVATPDASIGAGGGSIRTMLIVDPFAATVHRVIEMPSGLSAVAAVILGPREAYVQSWRDGFSGALGVISRSCTTDDDACDARLLTDLGDVGITSERTFLLRGPDLYSVRLKNSGKEDGGVVRVRVPSGEVVAQQDADPLTFAATDQALFTIGFLEEGYYGLARLDLVTLAEAARTPLDVGFEEQHALIASYDGRLYVSGIRFDVVEVRSPETLEIIDTIDISTRTSILGVNYGFVAPGLLMLNERDFLDVRTGEMLAGALPVDPQPGSQALRFPEGHPLANGGSF